MFTTDAAVYTALFPQHALCTPYLFYKQPLFLAEPGKEIEITTSKLTTMCLKNQQFQPMCAYKLRAYKRNTILLKTKETCLRVIASTGSKH